MQDSRRPRSVDLFGLHVGRAPQGAWLRVGGLTVDLCRQSKAMICFKRKQIMIDARSVVDGR